MVADQIRMTTAKLNALRAKDSLSEAERALARRIARAISMGHYH